MITPWKYLILWVFFNEIAHNHLINDSQYISKLINPTNITEFQNIDKVINVLHVNNLKKSPEINKNKKPYDESNISDSRSVLTFKDLAKYLSLWQWARKQYFYNTTTSNGSRLNITI